MEYSFKPLSYGIATSYMYIMSPKLKINTTEVSETV